MPKKPPYTAPAGAEWVDPTSGKLTAWPPDFDCSKTRPPRIEAFASAAIWYDHRVAVCEELLASDQKKLDEARKNAEYARRLESLGNNVKSRKLFEMQARAHELEAELRAEGVDVDDLATKAKEATNASKGTKG